MEQRRQPNNIVRILELRGRNVCIICPPLRHDMMILVTGARSAKSLFHSCDQLCLYEGIVIGKFLILI